MPVLSALVRGLERSRDPSIADQRVRDCARRDISPPDIFETLGQAAPMRGKLRAGLGAMRLALVCLLLQGCAWLEIDRHAKCECRCEGCEFTHECIHDAGAEAQVKP